MPQTAAQLAVHQDPEYFPAKLLPALSLMHGVVFISGAGPCIHLHLREGEGRGREKEVTVSQLARFSTMADKVIAKEGAGVGNRTSKVVD